MCFRILYRWDTLMTSPTPHSTSVRLVQLWPMEPQSTEAETEAGSVIKSRKMPN